MWFRQMNDWQRQMNEWQRQMNEQPRQMNVLLVCKFKLKHLTRHLNEPPRQMKDLVTNLVNSCYVLHGYYILC